MATYLIGFRAPLTGFDQLVPAGYRLIPIEDRHLTLVYIGPLRRLTEIVKALETLEGAGLLTLTFRGLTALPSLSKPRYLAVLPVEDSAHLLERLRCTLLNALEHVPLNERYSVFKPHVSIARLRRKSSFELLRVVERSIRASRRVREEMRVYTLSLLKAERGSISEVFSVQL